MSAALARHDLELHMLEGMVDGAHGLGMRIVTAAEAERDVHRLLAFTDAFNRCFHAVRMGIRLCMTLRAPARPAAASAGRDAGEPAERDEGEREPLRDRPDRETDRERDSDYEPVSLQRFLATLRGVTGDAGRLDVGAKEAAQLRSLLAEVDAAPAPAAVAVKARPASLAKARYLGSAAPLANPRPAHPRASGDPGFFRRPRPPPSG